MDQFFWHIYIKCYFAPPPCFNNKPILEDNFAPQTPCQNQLATSQKRMHSELDVIISERKSQNTAKADKFPPTLFEACNTSSKPSTPQASWLLWNRIRTSRMWHIHQMHPWQPPTLPRHIPMVDWMTSPPFAWTNQVKKYISKYKNVLTAKEKNFSFAQLRLTGNWHQTNCTAMGHSNHPYWWGLLDTLPHSRIGVS